ncbi:MAG: plastocyanin/azurin family copper-binding protein [Actinomycetota bacterium]
MRRKATLLLALLVLGLTAGSGGATELTPSEQAAIDRVAASAAEFQASLPGNAAEFNHIFAGGGTPVSNALFFPGTATCTSSGCTYLTPVPQVRKGTDIVFVNLDEGAVANSHRIVCKKRDKKGRPKCFSEQLDSPGEQSRMITTNMKPGIYGYFCSTHAGMEGAFEIIK